MHTLSQSCKTAVGAAVVDEQRQTGRVCVSYIYIYIYVLVGTTPYPTLPPLAQLRSPPAGTASGEPSELAANAAVSAAVCDEFDRLPTGVAEPFVPLCNSLIVAVDDDATERPAPSSSSIFSLVFTSSASSSSFSSLSISS